MGRQVALPPGYRGLVLGKMNQQTGYMAFDDHTGSERVEFEKIAECRGVTEWKKDCWGAERGYVTNVLDYIECAKIMNSEE